METSDRLDMLVLVIPKINPDAPTVGPAVLKSHLMANGFSCEVMDLNIKLYNALKDNSENELHWFEDDSLFSTHHTEETLNQRFVEFYHRYEHVFMGWVEVFKQKNPRWIGLSLLSIYSQSVAVKVSQLIRVHLPKTKIVWGGAQIEYGVDDFKNRGLMDHYIFGDGERSVVELLKGNFSYKGIDDVEKPNQVLDLDSVMLPNYDDIEWSEYDRVDFPDPIYITGSRGCVKRCTFCNVYDIWPEYRFRKGEKIAEEMIYVKERYGRKTFRFTDSLINGSMKSFRSLLRILSDYRKENPDFSWTSQWIIRSKRQSPENDFRMIKESGCSMLEIGLESFNQDVRFHMGKKFTDEDMWYCLDMLQKYGIPHVLLMIVGYPTETKENHDNTIRVINRLFDNGYAKTTNEHGDRLLYFSFGNTLMLSTAMPLYDLIKDDVKNFNSNIDWEYKDNNLVERIRRFNEINDLIKERNSEPTAPWLTEKAIRNYKKKLNNDLDNDRWDG